MTPKECDRAFSRLFELLKPGGKLFLTVGSPFIKVYKGFDKEYNKRLSDNKIRYPGFIENVRKYHPDGATHNAGQFLFFGPEEIGEWL